MRLFKYLIACYLSGLVIGSIIPPAGALNITLDIILATGTAVVWHIFLVGGEDAQG